VGLIASAAWTIGKVAVSDVIGIVIALVTCVLIAKWRLHPIFLVAGAAVAGILFY
jgi:chromate transport protein ChrA